MGRVVFPLWGPLDRWWIPCYTRLNLSLVLTPIKEDAGADLTFEFPFPSPPDLNGWAPGSETDLLPEHLPDSSWPPPADPTEAFGSPFSGGERDYLRVIGPGLFVGCAYRGRPRASGASAAAVGSLSPSSSGLVYNEEDCVYFAIARRMTKEEYLRRLDEEEDLDSDDDNEVMADENVANRGRS